MDSKIRDEDIVTCEFVTTKPYVGCDNIGRFMTFQFEYLCRFATQHCDYKFFVERYIYFVYSTVKDGVPGLLVAESEEADRLNIYPMYAFPLDDIEQIPNPPAIGMTNVAQDEVEFLKVDLYDICESLQDSPVFNNYDILYPRFGYIIQEYDPETEEKAIYYKPKITKDEAKDRGMRLEPHDPRTYVLTHTVSAISDISVYIEDRETQLNMCAFLHCDPEDFYEGFRDTGWEGKTEDFLLDYKGFLLSHGFACESIDGKFIVDWKASEETCHFDHPAIFKYDA